MSELSNLIKDVVASPLGEVIAAVGQGVAEAQQALDEGSLAKTLEIYSESGAEGLRLLREIGYAPTFYTLPETIGEVRVAMRLGNNQNTLANTTAAAQTLVANNQKMATKLPVATRATTATKTPAMTATTAATTAATATKALAVSALALKTPAQKAKIYATPVDASYANRYAYQADISAKLTFKIVPVPPMAGVENLRVLPVLIGDTASNAQDRLARLDLIAHFVDDNGEDIAELGETQTVIAQSPGGDEAVIARAGDVITLTLSSD